MKEPNGRVGRIDKNPNLFITVELEPHSVAFLKQQWPKVELQAAVPRALKATQENSLKLGRVQGLEVDVVTLKLQNQKLKRENEKLKAQLSGQLQVA